MLLGLVVLIAGCAGSRARDCDPQTTSCEPDAAAPPPVIDARVDPIADAAPDGAPLRGFGAACTDGDQCASDVCILAGIGGICSQLCGECPDGYGCFGVLGAIDPDQVAFVCVPTSTQLCSPCQADRECTLLGMDKCLAEPTGRSYCSRDCSSVACPTGYDCDSKVIDDVPYKQCVPHSQACDCQSAGQAGATDACSITTPLGTSCAGASTCGGAAGWGACLPPSQTDDPDASYTDDNCDGIDGDLTRGVFVSGGGANSVGCGAFNAPCQTISFGITRAAQTGKPNVYVQAGTYTEVVVLLDGINIWGGYDFQWHRGPYANPANRVTVIGKQDTGPGGNGEYLTVRARNLAATVTIGDLVLQGPNAQGMAGLSELDGRSSYVLHALTASISLIRVQIVAGDGAPGGAGSAGLDAPVVDVQSFMNGGVGQDGQQGASLCNDTSRGGGGGAGVNTCSGGRNPSGGAGGRGGTKDNNCPLGLAARAGDAGTDAAFVSGQSGLSGAGGSGNGACGPTGNGHDGVKANGAGGLTSGGGILAGNLYWYARPGGTGGVGDNGSGGGGGGGGGGCDNGTDAFGGGGGGGGAGGCAARGGGGGGGGGGGSFGVVAVNSTITLQSCDLFRGTGASGGSGGAGGRGQSGGARGTGGLHPGSATPGLGGFGVHGGHGGGGAGGGGGRSVGILLTPDSTVHGTCTQSQGAAGSGGAGGASAPNAPAADRDGNPGNPGAAGTLEDTRTCVDPGTC
jgi:hypothetical protein